jgi:ABC-type nitrate/sulfonate/bicarbonate transport system substrate-binding protein
MTLEEWRKVATEEGNDPRVLQALNERGAALAVLGRAIAASELCFTVEAFAVRRREIAERWNAAVSFTKTIYRHCEWCARRVVYRHRLSRFCSDKCKQAAKDADPERRQRRKARRALVEE